MKNIYPILILTSLSLTLFACGNNGPQTIDSASRAGIPEEPNPGTPPTSTTTTTLPPNPEPPVEFNNFAKLPWEASGKSRDWSLYLYKQIDNASSVYFKGADDITTFCPNYYALNRQEQTEFWAQLMVQMIKYESNYNPVTRFKEPGGNVDPITKQAVYSEGLFQLSYQDTQWMPECQFVWSKDKLLAITDPKRTILDPYKNLHCGVLIMKRQLTKYKKIAISTGAYWAVIKTNSTYNKLPVITAATKALPYCKK